MFSRAGKEPDLRPRKDGARRRATTTASRRPETDLGSPELLYRKTRAANGSGTSVELIDAAGILCANNLISVEELATLRQLAPVGELAAPIRSRLRYHRGGGGIDRRRNALGGGADWAEIPGLPPCAASDQRPAVR